jgi:hypothetical protein
MSGGFNQCRIPGCGSPVPAELKTEILCIPHFLFAAESVCAAMRRETARPGPDATRRTEIENYVAASAMKLARLGTGTVRISDETKKRLLTTFHTLMILRENLDRASNLFQPRLQASKSETPLVSAAALG